MHREISRDRENSLAGLKRRMPLGWMKNEPATGRVVAPVTRFGGGALGVGSANKGH